MTFAYNLTIPATNDFPGDDQPIMQSNAASISGIIAVDHVGFNASGGGQHNQVTFNANNIPALPATPPVLFTNNRDGAGNLLPGSLAELFFYSGTAPQSSAQYISLGNGSTMLMGGIILKWFSFTTALTVFTVTYASLGIGNFPNNAFVAFSQVASTSSIIPWAPTAVSTTQITLTRSGSAGSVTTYVAIIGN